MLVTLPLYTQGIQHIKQKLPCICWGYCTVIRHKLTSLLHRQWIQHNTQKSPCVSWVCYAVIWHKYIRWRCHAIDNRYDPINKNHRAFVEFVITVIWHKCVRWRCHPIVQIASKTKKTISRKGICSCMMWFITTQLCWLLHTFVRTFLSLSLRWA